MYRALVPLGIVTVIVLGIVFMFVVQKVSGVRRRTIRDLSRKAILREQALEDIEGKVNLWSDAESGLAMSIRTIITNLEKAEGKVKRET